MIRSEMREEMAESKGRTPYVITSLKEHHIVKNLPQNNK